MNQTFRIKKKFTWGIKLSNGELKSFTTELETDVEVDSKEKFIEESDKLFQKATWLCERDVENYFNKLQENG